MEPSKKSPAFQLYPQDFISSLDVQLMSAAEVGAYCLLLFNSWTQTRQGYLPNDEKQLQIISRLEPEQWKKSKKKLLAKFAITPDKKFRYNPRLASEADKQTQFRTKQAENGKRGGRPRRDEPSTNPDAPSVETQNNPGLSSGFILDNPKKALPSSTSFSSSTSSSEREKEAAPLTREAEKKIEGELQQQRPAETQSAANEPPRCGHPPSDEDDPPLIPQPLAEGERIPGGFADPRLDNSDPRKWIARPENVAMIDDFLAHHDNPEISKHAGKGHLFWDHYEPNNWVRGQYHTPIQNWRALIPSFKFREQHATQSTFSPAAAANAGQRPAPATGGFGSFKKPRATP